MTIIVSSSNVAYGSDAWLSMCCFWWFSARCTVAFKVLLLWGL